MGRDPRVHFAGAVYHAMARAIEGHDLFLDDCDRRVFLALLQTVRNQSGARLFGYCLMPNHFHLALQVAEVPLSAIMGRLMTRYAVYFNARHHRKGHLFRERYKPVLVVTDRQLIALIRYIHNNPVRSGLVKHPSEWEWSSYREYRDASHKASRVEQIEGITASDEPPDGFDPWLNPLEDSEAALLRPPRENPPDLKDIAAEIAAASGVAVAELLSSNRRRVVCEARRHLVQAAVRAGVQPVALAKALGVTQQSISRYLADTKK